MTPGLQGIALIHYTTAASLLFNIELGNSEVCLSMTQVNLGTSQTIYIFLSKIHILWVSLGILFQFYLLSSQRHLHCPVYLLC